jgi:uncharacterized RDD family membrane protein YckC
MGSALLNTTIADPTFAEAADGSAVQPGSAAALRQQVAERLAAHRSRRGGTQPAAAPRPESPQAANTRAARIAAAVAERYAHTQSYRAFLAAEAERAVQQARAAAEIATLNAQAVAAAQQRLLDTFDRADAANAPCEDARTTQPLQEIPAETAGQPHAVPPQASPREQSLWPELDVEDTPAPIHRRHHRSHRAAVEARTSNPEPRTSNLSGPTFTVRLYEDATSAAHLDLAAARHTASANHLNRDEEHNNDETRALDEEIAFRQAPVFEEPAGPPMPLPANLIEFPRQLVASRKARPRYAEGPLRGDETPAPGDGQLRIFEVDPAQISTQPDAVDSAVADATMPQWTSIWLDAPDFATLAANNAFESLPGEQSAAQVFAQAAPYPDAAPMGRRTLAAAINAGVLLAGLLAFAAVFVAVAGHWQPGTPLHAVIARTGLPLSLVPATAAITAAFLYLLYQALFFSLSDATPGMRCVRIALCTFDDENPTRRAMRRRILAVLVSAIPFGLGLLWAALDEDRLTWHDRIARMYQRSY